MACATTASMLGRDRWARQAGTLRWAHWAHDLRIPSGSLRIIMISLLPSPRPTSRLGHALGPALLLGLGLAVSLALLEIFLRVVNPFGERIRGDQIVLPTHARRVIQNTNYPRVDKRIVVSTNSLGFRGPEPPPRFAEALTVLTVGGSTTECLYVSDGKTWPDLVGRELRGHFRDLWINNAGLDGHSTFGHRLLLEQRIARLRPKVVLFLIGINDVGREDLKAADAAVVAGGAGGGIWAHAVGAAAEHSAIVSTALNLLRYREARKLNRIHRELQIRWARVLTPDRERARATMAEHRDRYIPGYAQRVEGLVRQCRRFGIEPILVTQPALYGNVVDPTTKVFLGTLEVDADQQLYGALAWNLLEAYNDVVRDVGRRRGVLVIDLARELPKDSRLFYDFVHFNNDGSAAVAAIISAHLCPFLAARYPAHVTSECPPPLE
jgi:lysophospholipase L1-like esterase